MSFQFITLCLLYCFQSPVSNAIPFIYFRSDLQCKVQGQWALCTEADICENEYEFEFINKNGIESLTMEYGLICNKRLIEATILSLGFLGEVSAYILAIVTEIPKHKKARVISAVMLFQGLLLFSLAFIKGQIIYTIFVIFLWNFIFSYLYSQMFAYSEDMYSPEIKEATVNYFNIAWTGGAVLFALFSQITGNWIHHCAYFGGLVVLILSIVFTLLQSPPYQENSQISYSITLLNEGNEVTEAELRQQNFIGDLISKFRELRKEQFIFLNAILYALVWTIVQSSYNITFIGFNSLGGNIQLVVFISIIVDFISSIVAKTLLSKYDPLRLLLNNLLVIGIIQLSMVVVTNENYYLQVFCILATKVSTRILFPTAMTLLSSIVPQQFNQLVFNIGNVIAIGIVSFVPYYRYFMDNIGVNIFSGIGACTLFYLIIARKFKVFDNKSLLEGFGRKSTPSRRKSEKILDEILRRSSMMTSQVQMMLLDKNTNSEGNEDELIEMKQFKQI